MDARRRYASADARPSAPGGAHRGDERVCALQKGGVDRVLSPGDTVVSPPGESHTVGPAGNEDVEMVAELRPAFTYEQFIERSFALDRAGHVNAKGRGNPPRMATAKPHEAEFFLARSPIGLQRALLRALAQLGRRLPGG